MLVTLGTQTLDNWAGSGTGATLRIAANSTFTSSGGAIVAGQYDPSPWYRDLVCTVGTRVDGQGGTVRTLLIPTIEIPSTADSPDNPAARFSFYVKGSLDSEFVPLPGFGSIAIPAQSPLTWQALLAYNRLPEVPPVQNWQELVLALIQSATGVAPATTGIAGKVKISAAAQDGTNPIVVSITDARMQPATPTQDGLMSASDKKLFNGYIHEQLVPASSWVITHNLGRLIPNVEVLDSANSRVIGDVSYQNTNQLTISFSATFAGKAFIG